LQQALFSEQTNNNICKPTTTLTMPTHLNDLNDPYSNKEVDDDNVDRSDDEEEQRRWKRRKLQGKLRC
jgi:hypothetical protein